MSIAVVDLDMWLDVTQLKEDYYHAMVSLCYTTKITYVTSRLADHVVSRTDLFMFIFNMR